MSTVSKKANLIPLETDLVCPHCGHEYTVFDEEEILSLDAQLKSVSEQITESEKARNHIEFGKLGEHTDALFGAMSKLSKK